MGLFSSNSNEKFSRGDRVRVPYAGVEGIVVEANEYQVMISYQNEKDEEVVKEFPTSDVQKM